MVTKARMSKKRYLKALEDDMKFCSLSESTKKQYRFIVTRYLDFTNNNPEFSRVELMYFIGALGNVTSTYSAWVLTIIKRFHRTMQDILPKDKKKWPLGPREGPKVVVRQQPSFGNEAIINKLFSVIKDNRDYAMARLLFATGMRRDEICRLSIDNYDEPNITFQMSKGEEFRTVRLDNVTCRAIDEYLEAREDRRLTLFLNNHSRPFTPDALSQVFKKYFNRIGAEKRTGFHAFRRGLVTLLYERGMGETEIQKFIGWKSREMVSRYIQFTPSRIGEDVRQIHPFYEE